MGAGKQGGKYRPLYIAATEEKSGKSAVALGLCLLLRKRGIDAGYFKPVGAASAQIDSKVTDADVLQAREALGLDEDIEDLCPVVLRAELIDRVLRGGRGEAAAAPIKQKFKKLSAGRDIIIVEGFGELASGAFIGAGCGNVAGRLDAPIMLIARYGTTNMLDRVVTAGNTLKDGLLGTVFNFVPRGRQEQVETAYKKFLKRQGIEVYGTIRSNPKLSAVPVSAIAQQLGAEILCAEAESGRLAQSLLIGAMNQEHALRYFQRVADKVVITGGDRADIILAALETPTAAVVLTGNFMPSPSVIGRAEELGVPLLLTGMDTLSAAREVQGLFGRFRDLMHRRGGVIL
ncbi:MAG: phosphotransacetylase family protein, partial [Actinomycetota bacterium]